MIKKLTNSDLDYQTLMDTYSNEGLDQTISTLEERKNGRPIVIKSTKVLNAILSCLTNDRSKLNYE